MADVGHAGADEHLIDFVAGNVGEGFDVVGVVGAGHDRLGDRVEVDVDHSGVVGIGVGFQQLRVGQPILHGFDAARQGAGIAVTAGNHVFEQRHIAAQVFAHGVDAELDRAASAGAFRSGVGEFEGLLQLEIGQAFNLHDAAVEDVLLAGFLHREEPFLDRHIRNGIDHITQGDAGLKFAAEAHQHRFRHVEWHGADGRGEGHQTGACGEGDAQGESGVAIAAGAHGVGQQHAVEPAVDDAVAGAQGHSAAVAHEVGQLGVGFEVHRLGIGRGVAEALHHQIGGEAKAGQLLHLIAGHRPGGVLAANAGHQWFAAGARAHTRQSAGSAHHFLRQREALAVVGRGCWADEQLGGGQAQLAAHLVGQGTTNHQRNAAARPHFIADGAGLEIEAGHHVAIALDRAGMGPDGDHITAVEPGDVAFDRQSAGIFCCGEKDGGDLATQDHATTALVGHMGDVAAGVPQHRVNG